MSETQARQSAEGAGRKVRVAVLLWREATRGLGSGEPRGFLQAVLGEDGQVFEMSARPARLKVEV